jgi:hypothetical protein
MKVGIEVTRRRRSMKGLNNHCMNEVVVGFVLVGV